MANPLRYRFQPAWWIMTVMAIAIAGYAFAFFFVESLGSADLKAKFATIPFAAWSHIIGGGIALLLGTFQMNAGLRKKSPGVHRLMGKIYLMCILLSGVGGLVLAWNATGGLFTKAGFGMLGILWLYTGTNAYLAIRKGDIAAHRRWMIRNYALTLAAVTLRIYLPLSMASGATFLVAYTVIAWMCWVPNLIVAEWFFIRRPQGKSVRRSTVESAG